MNKFSSKIQIVGFSTLAAVFLLSATTFAVTLPDQANNPLQRGKVSMQTRLQDAKLKSCQVREKGIKNRSIHLGDLAKNMQDKFDSILQRVQVYYTKTVIPSGKTVANYDSLVSDIQTKKTAVQDALTKAKNDFGGFSCSSNNPKGAMTKFREDMQAVKEALKNYRTAIKNLIVAVHSVTGEENKDNSNNKRETGNKQNSNAPATNIPATGGQGNR